MPRVTLSMHGSVGGSGELDTTLLICGHNEMKYGVVLDIIGFFFILDENENFAHVTLS